MGVASYPIPPTGPSTVRVISWNIMQGGGPRKQRIADQLDEWNADIAVLTEYRHSNGADLRAALERIGLAHQLAGEDPAGGYAGAIIASRFPIEQGPVALNHPNGQSRWLHAIVHEIDWHVVACFIPASSGPNGKEDKNVFWDAVIDSANELGPQPAIITGDLNTGRHFIDETGKTFHSADQFETILSNGWIDGFRELHGDIQAPTWWSPGYNNGFRLDHALLSPGSPIPTACRYETKDIDGNTICGPAKGKLSDHAAMIIDLTKPQRPQDVI